MYDTKMEFPEGWGIQFKKTFHGRGMDIFWNNTILHKFNIDQECFGVCIYFVVIILYSSLEVQCLST